MHPILIRMYHLSSQHIQGTSRMKIVFSTLLHCIPVIFFLELSSTSYSPSPSGPPPLHHLLFLFFLFIQCPAILLFCIDFKLTKGCNFLLDLKKCSCKTINLCPLPTLFVQIYENLESSTWPRSWVLSVSQCHNSINIKICLYAFIIWRYSVKIQVHFWHPLFSEGDPLLYEGQYRNLMSFIGSSLDATKVRLVCVDRWKLLCTSKHLARL